MTKDEELEQLRAENTALRAALQHQDTELDQAHQANQDLREGLKEAIIAIGQQHERVKTLEGLIDSLHERINTLERHQAKDSHNSSLPPCSGTDLRRYLRSRGMLAIDRAIMIARDVALGLRAVHLRG